MTDWADLDPNTVTLVSTLRERGQLDGPPEGDVHISDVQQLEDDGHDDEAMALLNTGFANDAGSAETNSQSGTISPVAVLAAALIAGAAATQL